MKKIVFLFIVYLFVNHCIIAQSLQKGPYTISVIIENVYHIEDANDSYPPGVHLDSEGKATGTNNCSDIYLIVGKDKALLIDLSNSISWDSSAEESLRSIVYDRIKDQDLLITLTHRHGDHLGMLPAFKDDKNAKFWIPEAEFSGMDIFPTERTVYFPENSSIDLGGGYMINTLEIPGHTNHSTLFFLYGKNVVFTGDAIGSGSGVWLFNEESFYSYINSIDNLIKYIENPKNEIDKNSLIIFGGHYWQRGNLDKLTSQYIYDMKNLIQHIGIGDAEMESMSSFMPFLNTNFRFGTATITWNKEAADKYVGSLKMK